jgi:hypothetical protein
MSSVLDATSVTVNTDGGTGANAGGNGRYVFAYNVSLGSGTKQNTQFQSFTGTQVQNAEIYSPNIFLSGVNSPNIPYLVGGSEAFGLLPVSARDLFTDQVIHSAAPSNTSIVVTRLDTGWGYDFAGYDLVLIGNLSDVVWENPQLGVGSRAAVPLKLGGWQYDARFGGTGDPILSKLEPGQVYATLIPDLNETSLKFGANVVGGGYRENPFPIADNQIVYLTNSLKIPLTTSDGDGTPTLTATASDPRLNVAISGSNLVITPYPGDEGYFEVEVRSQDRSLPGTAHAGREATQRFGMTLQSGWAELNRYNDVDNSSTFLAPPDELLEGAIAHVQMNGNAAVDPDEIRVADAAGRINVDGLSVSKSEVVYSANMSENPGWTFEGGTSGWAYGRPTGGSDDPLWGYSGANVVGFNLTGAYANSIVARAHATTPSIGIAGLSGLSLNFRRWLNIDSASLDQAGIQYSIDGGLWTNLWSHSGGALRDTRWANLSYAIPATGAEIKLRWYLGTTNSSVAYGGWNIDDVIVTGSRVVSPYAVSFLGATSGNNPSAVIVTPTPGQILSAGNVRSLDWVEAGNPVAGTEGSSLVLSGTVRRPSNATTLEYLWTITDLDGNVAPEGQGNWTSVPGGTNLLSPQFSYLPRDAGTLIGRLEIRGQLADNSPFNFHDRTTLNIAAAGPTLDLGNAFTIVEGAPHTWTGLLNNLSSDEWLVEIDGDGDGVFERSFTTANSLRDLQYAWLRPSPDNGDLANQAVVPYNFRVRVTDQDDNLTVEDSVLVTVTNSPPVLLGTDITLNEGVAIGDRIRFRDGSDNWVVTATLPGGITETANVIADATDSLGTTWIVNLNSAFANQGSYAIQLQIADLTDGSTTNYVVNATVNNVAPQYQGGISGPATADEITKAAFSSLATDVPADAITYQWDFDYNGTSFDIDALGAEVNFFFPNQGTYTVAVRATDGDDAAAILTHTVTVSNSPPVIDVAGLQTNWTEGQTISIIGPSLVRDAVNDTVQYLWELSDGGPVPIFVSTSPTFTYAVDNQATYSLTLIASDQDSSARTETWTLTVANETPTFNLAASGDTLEGRTITVTASDIVDPGTADTLIYSWSAVGPQGQSLTLTGTISTTFVPVDEGTYWVTLSISDGTSVGTRTIPVVIGNDDPTLSSVNGNSATPSNSPLRLTGTAGDLGTTDQLTGIVDLGNGVRLPLELKNGDFKLDYQYRQSGEYLVNVSVRDLDGGVTEQSFVHRVDVDAPQVSIDTLLVIDSTPRLEGTIDDPQATVVVMLANKSYTATNHGDGTWSLADNVITPALEVGNHIVRAFSEDSSGNETIASDVLIVDPSSNQSPTAVLLSHTHVSENSAGSIVGTVSAIDPNAGDTLTYTVSDIRFEIVDSQLKLKLGQSLDYEAGASIVLTITATDSGGLATTSGLSISVLDVNEAPTFVKGTNLEVSDSSGAQSFTAWATNVAFGPVGETAQALTFQVTTDMPNLFSAPPAIDHMGTLTFTPAPNAYGTAVVSVRLFDSGGTANGGIDASDVQTVQIVVDKPYKWHNTLHGLDVTGPGGTDQRVVAEDVIAIINYINAKGSGMVPVDAPFGPPYYDTNADNNVAADDVVKIINFINANGSGGTGPAGEAGSAIENRDSLFASFAGDRLVRPHNLVATPTVDSDLLLLLSTDAATDQLRRRRSQPM